MRTGPEKLRSRRTPDLAVEWLEGRDLPTAPALLAGPVSSADLGPLLARTEQTAAPVPQVPTPHELAREQFVAKFKETFDGFWIGQH